MRTNETLATVHALAAACSNTYRERETGWSASVWLDHGFGPIDQDTAAPDAEALALLVRHAPNTVQVVGDGWDAVYELAATGRVARASLWEVPHTLRNLDHDTQLRKVLRRVLLDALVPMAIEKAARQRKEVA